MLNIIKLFIPDSDFIKYIQKSHNKVQNKQNLGKINQKPERLIRIRYIIEFFFSIYEPITMILLIIYYIHSNHK